jgi:hypothetical protein
VGEPKKGRRNVKEAGHQVYPIDVDEGRKPFVGFFFGFSSSDH